MRSAKPRPDRRPRHVRRFLRHRVGHLHPQHLSDLAADRRHPRKRLRPLPAVPCPPPSGWPWWRCCSRSASACRRRRGRSRSSRIYAIASVSYSVALKEFPAGRHLHACRPLHGARARRRSHRAIPPRSGCSPSGFLFLSLALVKRVEEMTAVARSSGNRTRHGAAISRRHPDPADLRRARRPRRGAGAVRRQHSSLRAIRLAELLWGIVPLILFFSSAGSGLRRCAATCMTTSSSMRRTTGCPGLSPAASSRRCWPPIPISRISSDRDRHDHRHAHPHPGHAPRYRRWRRSPSNSARHGGQRAG